MPWLFGLVAVVALLAYAGRSSASESPQLDDHGLLRFDEGERVFFILNLEDDPSEPEIWEDDDFTAVMRGIGLDVVSWKRPNDSLRTAMVVADVAADPGLQVKLNTWFQLHEALPERARFTAFSAYDSDAVRAFNAN